MAVPRRAPRAAALLSAAVAVIVGFPVLRLRGHYLAVATLGLIFIVQSFAVNLRGLTRGALGLSGLPAATNLWWVYLFVVLTLFVAWRLKHSSIGRAMLAIRENELAAACLGVRVARLRIFAFALGAFFAGVAGGLWAHLVTLISPSSFSFLLAFQLVVMIVLGGAGSIAGVALVAAALTLAQEMLRPVEEAAGLFGASQIIVALATLLVLIYRPAGLFGTAEPDLLPLERGAPALRQEQGRTDRVGRETGACRHVIRLWRLAAAAALCDRRARSQPSRSRSPHSTTSRAAVWRRSTGRR